MGLIKVCGSHFLSLFLLHMQLAGATEVNCVELASISCMVIDSWQGGFAISISGTPHQSTDDWEAIIMFPQPINETAQVTAMSTNSQITGENRQNLTLDAMQRLTKDVEFSFVVILNMAGFQIQRLVKLPVTFYLHKNGDLSCHNSPAIEDANRCELLEGSEGYTVSYAGWFRPNNDWTFIAKIDKEQDRKGYFEDWTIKVVFENPVAEVKPYNFVASNSYRNGRVWFFTAASWNKKVQELHLGFQATVKGRPHEASSAEAYLCRDGVVPTPDITQPFFADTELDNEQINSTARCRDDAIHSRLPYKSRITNAKDFKPSNDGTKYDYNEVLHKSILFYEAQRSGKLPPNNSIPWRGDSGLKDGCDVGHDLSGGWYDAGDNVKFGFPMAYTATVLAWGMIEYRQAYIDAGEWKNALDMLKWATDYFIKAHTQPNELYVQVGDPAYDHSHWWRPEDYVTNRKSYKIDTEHPGSEVAAETAAALASASIVFEDENANYSELLVKHSEELYNFADNHRENYHVSVPAAKHFYRSWSGFDDELLWASIWIYKATGNDFYLNQTEDRYDEYGASAVPEEFSWDNKYAGVQVLLAQETESSKYRNDVAAFITMAKELQKTPAGLTWFIEWGPNRYAANFALIALMASKLDPEMPERQDYLSYAKQQIHLLLGSGDGKRSYVVGFGKNPPKHYHHRASSCPKWTQRPVTACTFDSFSTQSRNPHVLYGALVGGPDVSGNYKDVRDDYRRNEVATDYNAGFQSAVAGLKFFNE